MRPAAAALMLLLLLAPLGGGAATRRGRRLHRASRSRRSGWSSKDATTTDPLLRRRSSKRASAIRCRWRRCATASRICSVSAASRTSASTPSLERARVALRYELSPIHPVTKVAFDGAGEAAGVDAGQLRRALADRYGTTPRSAAPPTCRAPSRRRCAQLGYLHAPRRRRTPISRTIPIARRSSSRSILASRTEIGTVDIVGDAERAGRRSS